MSQSLPADATQESRQLVLLNVLNSIKKGDLSVRMPMEWTGIDGKIADTLNDIIDINEKASRELARVSQVVGKEGKLTERVAASAGDGVWARNTESINALISDLAQPTNEIARVIGAVAKGDLKQRMNLEIDGRQMRGEFLRTGSLVNTMVDQLSSFASEVTRVAREVGTEGKLGGKAEVEGVAGTWKDLTDNVNSMAGNLTVQLRDVSKVATAIAKGDLSQKITVNVRGEILQIKDTINTMVDQLSSFASEVTRVAREVGTEGKLGGQANVEGVAGTWKDLTDNVNSMADNLTGQVRNIAEVTTAVANGDLSKKITVDVKGEILELKDTVNTMVDQLSSFAAEVTRVAREVGSEGKLGGQANVKGVAGTWKDLTDNVNSMADNLTGQVRNIAEVTTAVANGDLSKKITVDVKGEIRELKDTINTMVDQLSSFASEVTRVAREVGTEGRLGGKADVQGVAGTWKDLTDNVNSMADNLTSQVRNIAEVTTAVANGDLSKKITVDVKGEIRELKDTINTMVDQLSSFASEVTRVAREVGTEGKLGGKADVHGVAGTWKDLTNNVNLMASNLTSQVRGIARVVTAVANGDLKKKLTVEAMGEVGALADTINDMIDTLATFADQVTGVARAVGVEGRLGGQAEVPGASGTWKDLTDNVNQLAANLTTQVRAIADVATAVTKGDLTRSIGVAAEGEVAVLKDTINEMIRNLKDTTAKNTEQDWLKTNLAKFTRMLQGQREMLTVCRLILTELAPLVNAQHGVFYIKEEVEGEAVLKMRASYAFRDRKRLAKEFRMGEGLVGECGLEQERILLTNVPTDYVQINSGLGEAPPLNIVVLPVMFELETKAVIELASFERFSPTHLAFLEQLTESIGIVLNTIEANSRTESLLQQSQAMAQELQDQQEELQQTNAELQEKARLLAEQKSEVERKNAEVEVARLSLEEKAQQLSLRTSDLLALNSELESFSYSVSHDLRTPLRGLTGYTHILLEEYRDKLDDKGRQYIERVGAAAERMAELIDALLTLSRVARGDLKRAPVDLSAIARQVLLELSERNPDRDVHAQVTDNLVVSGDEELLRLVLENLVSNAWKFTSARKGAQIVFGARRTGEQVVYFVQDNGAGFDMKYAEKLFVPFKRLHSPGEFQGTGVGLATVQRIVQRHGGKVWAEGEVGVGATFYFTLGETATSESAAAEIGEKVN